MQHQQMDMEMGMLIPVGLGNRKRWVKGYHEGRPLVLKMKGWNKLRRLILGFEFFSVSLSSSLQIPQAEARISVMRLFLFLFFYATLIPLNFGMAIMH